MPLYVVARKDSEQLETPVFHAGEKDEAEAIAVFSSSELAQEYIDDSELAAVCEVGTLDSLQLLRWIVLAHEQGTQFVVTNPRRVKQNRGEPLPVVDIEESLSHVAELLEHALR